MKSFGLIFASLSIRVALGGSSDYSFSLTTFSPEGELRQIEHAMAAVNNAPPAIGMCGEGCVVLVGVESQLPNMTEASGTPKAHFK